MLSCFLDIFCHPFFVAGVCASEGAHISSTLYRLVSAGNDVLQLVPLGWWDYLQIWSQAKLELGHMAVAGSAVGSRVDELFTWLRHTWILSDHWVNETAFRTLFSRLWHWVGGSVRVQLGPTDVGPVKGKVRRWCWLPPGSWECSYQLPWWVLGQLRLDPDCTRRDWNHWSFRVHNQHQVLQTHCLRHVKVWLPLGHLGYDASGDHSKGQWGYSQVHRGTVLFLSL